MSLSSVTKRMIEDRLKALNVAFLAKVLLVNGDKAKIQPLGLVRTYGETAQKQSVIANVHISQSARYKFKTRKILDGLDEMQDVVTASPIAVGDVVLCVCCDRNIDAALKGENSLPPVGYHSKSDCIIVSII